MRSWRRVFTRRACLWLVVISVIAPFLYALVQGYLALLLLPALRAFGIQSQGALQATFLAFSSVGAVLAATLLAFPLALLARQRSVLLGLLLGVATTITLVALQPSLLGATAYARLAIEYVVFILICAAVSQFASQSRVSANA